MSTSLILIPGLMCDETVWEHQRSALQDRVDIRVAVNGARRSLQAMAQAVLADAPPRFAVAGHSMGGRIALEVVRNAPERVTGLALLDTGHRSLPQDEAGARETAFRRSLIELARLKGMRVMGEEWVRGMVHPARLGDRDLVGRIVDMIAAHPVELLEAQMHALLERPDASALLPKIACPTLVLCGCEDAWSPLARHREIADQIRGSTLAGIPDCGHMSTMERPEAVSNVMREWLERVVPNTADPARVAH